MNPLGALPAKRKSGLEQIHSGGRPNQANLLSFWQWSGSDLLSNAQRGVLAEYLVALALECDSGVRTEWDAYDLLTPNGIKLEIKSAAYLQSWYQEKLSTIGFSIAPTFGWDAATNTSSHESSRQADAYVFAVLAHKEKGNVDPMDTEQWEFYVLATAALNEKVPDQKTISLQSLVRLNPIRCGFDGIKKAVGQALGVDNN